MTEIMKELNAIKPMIPQQTYRTIVGQMRAGDMGGATVGINRLKQRIEREGCIYANRSSKQPNGKKVEE